MVSSICVVAGCPRIATPGESRCPDHARPPWRKGSSTRKATLPKGWREIRAYVLERDGYRCKCEGCPNCWGTPCGTRANQVDHVGARDMHQFEYLRAACEPCHAHRSSKQGAAGRKPS
jgi:hypothetical protein